MLVDREQKLSDGGGVRQDAVRKFIVLLKYNTYHFERV